MMADDYGQDICFLKIADHAPRLPLMPQLGANVWRGVAEMQGRAKSDRNNNKKKKSSQKNRPMNCESSDVRTIS